MTAPELKHCPFCGGTFQVAMRDVMLCLDCYASGPQNEDRKAAWNTRFDLHDATERKLAKAVEALRNIAVVGFSSDPSVNGAIAKQTVLQARAVLAEIEKGWL